MKMLLDNIHDKVSKMSKQERIMRLIELGVKQQSGTSMSIEELMEESWIQTIRHENGEIQKVMENREV